MPYAIASDGIQLYYEELGEGEPLLLIRRAEAFSERRTINRCVQNWAIRYNLNIHDSHYCI